MVAAMADPMAYAHTHKPPCRARSTRNMLTAIIVGVAAAIALRLMDEHRRLAEHAAAALWAPLLAFTMGSELSMTSTRAENLGHACVVAIRRRQDRHDVHRIFTTGQKLLQAIFLTLFSL